MRSMIHGIQREMVLTPTKNATKSNPLKTYWYSPQGKRKIGRPKKRWREQL